MSLQSERFHERNICLNIGANEVASVRIRPTRQNGHVQCLHARRQTMMHRSTPGHGYAGNFDWMDCYSNGPPPRHR
jgi:hypothetical protein